MKRQHDKAKLRELARSLEVADWAADMVCDRLDAIHDWDERARQLRFEIELTEKPKKGKQ